jgi:uncharacterized protein YcbK (DUF882 family)
MLAALGAPLLSSFSGRGALEVEPPSAPALAPRLAPVTPSATSRPPAAWAIALPAVRFVDTRTRAAAVVRLYAKDGSLSEEAACDLDRLVVAGAGAPPPPLNRRLLRLLVKAAAHFHATEINLVSTFRDNAGIGSRHRTGDAADFSMPGVPAARLAAHLRTFPRVGVGVYTNRRTQFVHLDVREQSYHWVDASPPGRTWRESPLTDRGAIARDAAYRPEQDLPEPTAPLAIEAPPPKRLSGRMGTR